MSNKLLFGTDPEIFAVYQKKNKFYCLPPYFFRKMLGVKASDDKRHPVFIEQKLWKLHEDGAAFEMAVRPSYNPRELFDTVQDCVRTAEQEIISNFPDYCMPKLQFLPSVGFEVERWSKEGEEFKMSTTFGCDPDWDAFQMDRKAEIRDASKFSKRFGGGHIHISGSNFFADDPILSVKCLALTAGLASVKYSDVPDLEKSRTFLYGLPGKFRVQNYGEENPFGTDYQTGIEYRTVSNTWAKNWEIAKEVFKWAEIGVRNLIETSLGNELIDQFAQDAANAIIECNQKVASQLLERIEERI